MLFNSYAFLFAFLPVTLLVYYWVGSSFGPAASKWWLSLASLFFYGWWNPPYVVLLIASIIFNYLISHQILSVRQGSRSQKLYLIFGIMVNLGVLVFYKYLFPLLGFLHQFGVTSTNLGSILLPLGLSFFTFTQLGYLLDCQQGVAKENSFANYVLFVTFFPHLIAGPILHHREMMPQFADSSIYKLKLPNLAIGLTLFTVGLAKKVMIADSLSPFVERAFSHSAGLDLISSWMGALSFSLQLYFDFSGYSDMALGLGVMFGVRLPQNFNSPFKSKSIIEFWQRFHMTLTRYLTLFLYSPIGLWVRRKRLARNLPVNNKALSTAGGFASMVAFPTLLTMFFAGVWHGAGFNFVIFGTLHGVYITINHAWTRFGPRQRDAEPSRAVPVLGKVALTYVAVVVSLVFFRADTLTDALNILAGMLGLNGSGLPLPLAARHFQYQIVQAMGAWGIFTSMTNFAYYQVTWVLMENLAWLAVAALICWGTPNIYEILGKSSPALEKSQSPRFDVLMWRPTLAWAGAAGVLLSVAVSNLQHTARFLYFQF